MLIGFFFGLKQNALDKCIGWTLNLGSLINKILCKTLGIIELALYSFLSPSSLGLNLMVNVILISRIKLVTLHKSICWTLHTKKHFANHSN